MARGRPSMVRRPPNSLLRRALDFMVFVRSLIPMVSITPSASSRSICFTNDILRSLLGADENDVATFTRNLRKERVRLVEFGNGLFEIKNVNAVALCEDIMLHARVPSACLLYT